jgi:hypothetical protein
VPPPIPFILEKELTEHDAIMREAAGAERGFRRGRTDGRPRL